MEKAIKSATGMMLAAMAGVCLIGGVVVLKGRTSRKDD